MSNSSNHEDKGKVKTRVQLYCKGRLGIGTTGLLRVKSHDSVVVLKPNWLWVWLWWWVDSDLKNTAIRVVLLFPASLSSVLRCGLTSHLQEYEERVQFQEVFWIVTTPLQKPLTECRKVHNCFRLFKGIVLFLFYASLWSFFGSKKGRTCPAEGWSCCVCGCWYSSCCSCLASSRSLKGPGASPCCCCRDIATR